MKHTTTITICIIFLFLNSGSLTAQPIPAEIIMGDKYGSVDVALNKRMSQDSRFGLFHLNMMQFYYDETEKNSFMFMDQLFVETYKNLMVLGGVSYSPMGFMSCAGIQYVFGGKNFMVILYPGIFISKDPSFYGINSFQYSPSINDKIKLLLLAELLNVFNSDGNVVGAQWLRLGIEVKGIQFGLGVNLDEVGPNPPVEANIGLFVRKEIF